MYLYVYTVFLAGKSLNIRSCTVYIYGSGQPYTSAMSRVGYTVYMHLIYAPYMTLYLVISLPKILYIHCIYSVLANPGHARHWLPDIAKAAIQPMNNEAGSFETCIARAEVGAEIREMATYGQGRRTTY